MTGRIPPDRWTCPACGKTVVPDTGDDVALALALRLAQTQHGERHDAEISPGNAR